MKRINILVIILLAFLTIYLLYRLHINSEYTKMDYLLLILLISFGLINSLIIIKQKKKGKKG